MLIGDKTDGVAWEEATRAIRFTFARSERLELQAALKRFPADQLECFIAALEVEAIAFVPWVEPTKLPGPKTRKVGLRRVAGLARELAHCIDDETGIVGADWHQLSRQVAAAAGDETSGLLHLKERLLSLEACARATESVVRQRPAPPSALHELAFRIALLMYQHFRVEPTCYMSDGECDKVSEYMAVLAICAYAWKPGAKGSAGELKRPASSAIKAFKRRLVAGKVPELTLYCT